MTGIITAKDHSDRHHVTDNTVMQQQFGDQGPAKELNLIDRQDHGMINIEELLNDWLREVM